MEEIRYVVYTPDMECDTDYIEVSGSFLPRIGDSIELDHSRFSGEYTVSRVEYTISPTVETCRNKQESDLEMKADTPFIILERAND